ncbi:MAG: hypothetical protein KZQ70_15120 [gamma proteobacterium symbiont of Lucinoma myriamae]|nr:hypothetical protein [gamma proteobacterium symbiont of Lucinoma myriamae]
MIFEKTQEFFQEEIANKKYNDSMKKILSKLRAQELKLEEQLKNEKDENKYKELSLKLKVISKQISKGKRLIQGKNLRSSKRHNIVIKPELSPRI